MLKSKALKESPKRFLKSDCGCPEGCPKDRNFIYKIAHKIASFVMFEAIYPIESFFRRNKERLFRSLQYARIGWHNYDFDFSYVWELLNFKFKRLYKTLENGHAYQESEDMEALHNMIKITRRLHKGSYDNKYHRKHDRKWGKLQHESLPVPEKDGGKTKYYRWNSWRSKTLGVRDEIKEQEKIEFRACFDNGEKDRLSDLKKLFKLIEDHGANLWD